MLPRVQLFVWDQRCLAEVADGKWLLIFLPQMEFAAVKDKAHLDLCHGGESIRIGQIRVLRQTTVPCGRVTPDLWARCLGPRDEEVFIAAVRKQYGLPQFDRFCVVCILEVEVEHLDEKFLQLQTVI